MKKNDDDELSSEGRRWLEMLGRKDLVGTLIPYYDEDGRQLCAEEFPKLDREAVEPIFNYIESLAADDPRRAVQIEAANASLDYWLNKPVDGD